MHEEGRLRKASLLMDEPIMLPSCRETAGLLSESSKIERFGNDVHRSNTPFSSGIRIPSISRSFKFLNPLQVKSDSI